MTLIMKASDQTWYVEHGDGVGLKKAEYGEEGCWSLEKGVSIDGEGYGGGEDDSEGHGCFGDYNGEDVALNTLNKRRVALGTCRLHLMYSEVRLEHGVRSQREHYPTQKWVLNYHHRKGDDAILCYQYPPHLQLGLGKN